MGFVSVSSWEKFSEFVQARQACKYIIIVVAIATLSDILDGREAQDGQHVAQCSLARQPA